MKLSAEGDVVGGGELNGRGSGKDGAAGKQGEDGAGGKDGGGDIELAAVVEEDLSREVLVGFEGRSLFRPAGG